MTRKLLSTLLLHTDDAALYDTFLTILKEDGRLSDRFWQLFDGVAHVRTQSLLSQWDAERDKVVKVGSFESEKSSTPPEPQSENPDDRKHYVYLCEPTPRQNYHVRAVKKGCGFYQVLSTRRTESTSKSPWMAVCPRCGKRSRMDLRTKHRYLTRDAAMAAAEERNQEESDATG